MLVILMVIETGCLKLDKMMVELMENLLDVLMVLSMGKL